MNNYHDTKVAVMDLLNQILILTKDVPTPPEQENEDTGDSSFLSSYDVDFDDQEQLKDLGVDTTKFPTPEALDNAVYLKSVASYCGRTVKGDADTANRNETKYYSSSCW